MWPRRDSALADLDLLVPRYQGSITVLARFGDGCVKRGFADIKPLIEDRNDGLLGLAHRAAAEHVIDTGSRPTSVEDLRLAFLALGRQTYEDRLVK